MNPADIPIFRGYRTPADSDALDRARSQISTGFAQVDIPMTVASASTPGNSNGWMIFNVAGDFLYVDNDPVASAGLASLQFNVQQDAAGAKFYIQPGFTVRTVFKQLALSWAAQAGKSLRLLVGNGDQVWPAFTAQLAATINNTAASPANIAEQGFIYGASYKSNTALLATTPEPVFSAASNTNGATIWQAEGGAGSTVAMLDFSLVCKATAPATSFDGVIVAIGAPSACMAGFFFNAMRMARAVNIPAGLRADFMSQSAETGVAVLRSVLYTLK